MCSLGWTPPSRTYILVSLLAFHHIFPYNRNNLHWHYSVRWRYLWFHFPFLLSYCIIITVDWSAQFSHCSFSIVLSLVQKFLIWKTQFLNPSSPPSPQDLLTLIGILAASEPFALLLTVSRIFLCLFSSTQPECYGSFLWVDFLSSHGQLLFLLVILSIHLILIFLSLSSLVTTSDHNFLFAIFPPLLSIHGQCLINYWN